MLLTVIDARGLCFRLPCPWFVEKRNIVLVIGLAFFVLAGATTFHFYDHHKNTLRTFLKEDRTTAELFSLLLEGQLDKIIRTMASYAKRPLLLQAVMEENTKTAREHLVNLGATSPGIDIQVIADKQGRVWASQSERTEMHGMSFACGDWYRGVSRGWKPYVSDIALGEAGEKDAAAHIAVPFFDEKGEVIGILVNTQRVVGLQRFIKRLPLEPEAAIFIMDRSGNMVYGSLNPVIVPASVRNCTLWNMVSCTVVVMVGLPYQTPNFVPSPKRLLIPEQTVSGAIETP